jgi:hypothetical protein
MQEKNQEKNEKGEKKRFVIFQHFTGAILYKNHLKHLITGTFPFLDRVLITCIHSEEENKTFSTVRYKVKE